MTYSILLIHNIDTLNICMKEFYTFFFYKMTATRTIFRPLLNRRYAFAKIMHTRTDQILPQLLMKPFNTKPSQNAGTLAICMKKFNAEN